MGLIKSEIKKGIAPKLLDIIESLPSKTGVYYIHNQNGNIIYIGKSNNIKKRINQHFTGITKKSKRIQNEVYTVNYDETGSELIALLKESQEIKITKPILNRAQRKNIFIFALYLEQDGNGYLNLKLQKTDGRKKEITSFASLQEGKSFLYKLTEKFQLCQKLNGLYETKKECFQFSLKECNGACINKEPKEIYNERVQNCIQNLSLENKNMIIIDRGRNINERSAILVENGLFKGYVFYDLNYQITNPEVLKNILIPMESNRDIQRIIQAYIRKNKAIKIIHF